MPERQEQEDLPLGHWIKRAFLALTGHVNDLLRPHELTYSQWQVLSFVARRPAGAATQRGLQGWLKVEAATLTGGIDGLVRRGGGAPPPRQGGSPLCETVVPPPRGAAGL